MKDRKSARRMGFKSSSTGPWNDVNDNYGDCSGVCPACGLWHTELGSDGYCREDQCKHDRLIAALKNGEARMTPTGVLIWTPGDKTFPV